MNKNLLSIIIAVVLIVLGSLLIIGWSSLSGPKVDITEIILFYGDGCPHCKLVEDFISQNKVEEKIKFTRLRIPLNNEKDPELLSNIKVLLERAKACGINTTDIGVPFLWDGKTCLAGDPDVIKFFQDKIK